MNEYNLLDLRPTQFVLGMKEVNDKTEKMSRMNEKELQKFCDEHIIPIIIGPGKEPYLIDHHHFTRACWELKVPCYKFKILANKSKMKEADFWNFLYQKKWINLRDQFGLGPHLPSALPIDIRSMADDPFRSLVWSLIDMGAIKKVNIPFFEFEWTDFFRLNLDIRLHSKSNFTDAIKGAKKLAKSKSTSHLPGHIK